MDKVVQITGFVSELLNILFIGSAILFIAKKGGVSYLLRKLALLQGSKSRITAMYDTPFYWDKKSHFETLPKSESEIIFLGDSLTDLCEWEELFKNNKIKNRGICGDTTEGILNRIDNIIEAKPQKLFILIGINDLNQGRKVEDVLNTYRNILRTLQEQIPKTQVFIQSVLPVNNDKFPNNGVNERIIKVNTELKDLAKEFSFHYIDLFSCFLDSQNQLDAQYTSDGIHLNGKGYLIWQKIIENDVVN
jgi:lysophospholipase L1-like esterase